MELLPQSRYSVTDTNCSLRNRSRQMGKRGGERPRVHFRSRVVRLCVPVVAVREVLAGVI